MYWISLLFTLFFITIFSETATLENPLSTFCYCVQPRNSWPHSMKDLFYFIISLFWLSAYMQKISMIQSFKQEVFVRILYSTNWLKPFQAITQEQEFSKIRDLYSKIDNNIIFIYRQFQQKSKAKCFKMEKPCFWVTFDHFCSFCQKGVFAKIWG